MGKEVKKMNHPLYLYPEAPPECSLYIFYLHVYFCEIRFKFFTLASAFFPHSVGISPCH